jgi:hypothetical protein
MTDAALIAALRANLDYLASRGFGNTAAQVRDLIKRFENLAECHRLLAEREERLTQELVALRP